jgi:serine protease
LALTTGSAAVPVAVLDTGITAHPELQGVWLPGVDVVSDAAMANDGSGRDADPTDPGDWVQESSAAGRVCHCDTHDSSWHGTIVSGILAARTDNNEGVAAVGGTLASCRCAWPASAAPKWPTSSTACAGPPVCW